ncbi:hypothetical protein [Reyranella sp.]|uniref:hypothetical protein n=1 Tax=Reyranella sp. TaxID=1929291 RepID=UPI003D099A7D
MLFHLDISPLQLAASNRDELTIAVQELLRAHRYGHHLIVIGRKETEWLAAELKFHPPERAMLAEIALEYTQTAGLLQRASRYVAIVPQPAASNGPRIEISLGDLKPYLLERTALLVEDVDTDGRFYALVFQALRKALRHGPLSWELVHGGGDRLPIVFQSKVTDRRVVCAIIDSDLSAPRSEQNAKIKRLTKIATELGWPHFHVAILPCREAENLIPLDILAKLGSAAQRTPSIGILRSIAEAEAKKNIDKLTEFWMYFDIKKGLSEPTLAALKKKERDWVQQRAKLINLDVGLTPIEGFGDKVLHQLLQSNLACSELVKVIATKNWRDCFAGLFSELLWLCLARTPKLT